MWVLGGHFGFLVRDKVDRVILDIMNDIVCRQGRELENFVSISSSEMSGMEGQGLGYLEDAVGS